MAISEIFFLFLKNYLNEVKELGHSFCMLIMLLQCFVSILICVLFHVKVYVMFLGYSLLTESLIRILALE